MSKNRSPNYPSVPLKDAIADIEAVFKKDMRNKMSADTVVKHLGYTSLNGRSLKKVATLKAYGLLDGRGDELRVTEDAIEIIAEAANSPKWQEKVKAAVFKPKVFEDINTHYEGARPSAEGLHSFLLKAGFTFEAIDTIIKVYMANFDLLAPMNLEKNNQDGMLSNGSIPPPPESDENIEVGDYIQWESEGAFQFEEARQVRAIQEYQGADWVFVKGSETGIPMEQVVLDKKGEINGSQANLKPPVLPESPQKQDEPTVPKKGFSKEVWHLDEGDVVLVLPDALSPDSFHDLDFWLNGIRRKVARRAGVSLKTAQDVAKDPETLVLQN